MWRTSCGCCGCCACSPHPPPNQHMHLKRDRISLGHGEGGFPLSVVHCKSTYLCLLIMMCRHVLCACGLTCACPAQLTADLRREASLRADAEARLHALEQSYVLSSHLTSHLSVLCLSVCPVFASCSCSFNRVFSSSSSSSSFLPIWSRAFCFCVHYPLFVCVRHTGWTTRIDNTHPITQSFPTPPAVTTPPPPP